MTTTQLPATIEYQWDESMSTGNNLIDLQHKELLRQMNLLMQAMSRGEGTHQIDSLLNFLANYTRQHFGYEEDCMNKARCPIAQANKAAHDQFIQKLGVFQEQLKANTHSNGMVAVQLMREMSSWLINHIKRIDTQLRTCGDGRRA